MHDFANPVITTNERIIIRAVLGFEEEGAFIIIFYHIWAWQTMEHDHLNKLSLVQKMIFQNFVWERKFDLAVKKVKSHPRISWEFFRSGVRPTYIYHIFFSFLFLYSMYICFLLLLLFGSCLKLWKTKKKKQEMCQYDTDAHAEGPSSPAHRHIAKNEVEKEP